MLSWLIFNAEFTRNKTELELTSNKAEWIEEETKIIHTYPVATINKFKFLWEERKEWVLIL